MEEKWPHFKEETHNLRIYLAADGVNPFTQCGLFLLSTITFLLVVNKEGEHNVVNDYSRYFVSTTVLFQM